MEAKNIQGKIVNATKWSSITELLAKIIVPLTNVILARILAPEAFGVIATITMIISFAEMLAVTGFQNYLVQHQFKSQRSKYNSANVAFWSNMIIAFILWGIIALFNEQIAVMVGNPGLGFVIIIACIQLPLTSIISVQMALFRRGFNFKILFFARITTVLVPLVITIPLALIGFGYWSLIIGMISMQFINAIILTVKSVWKPKFWYNFATLKKMFRFSAWSLLEAISIWLTIWIDTFIIGYYLNEYYLGLYKTSTIMVNSLLSIVTAAAAPVLFAALSRLQDDTGEFKELFFKFQRFVSILVIPMGVGVYLYSDLATELLLGSQWSEASNVVGIWALTSAFIIVFGHFSSEVYRAKGKPNLSFLAQLLHLIILVPTCIIAAKYGFWALVFARAFIRFQSIIVHFILMRVAIKISVLKTIKNVLPTIAAASIMTVVGILLKQVSNAILWDFVSIIVCVCIYFGVLMLHPTTKLEIKNIAAKFLPNKIVKLTGINS